MELDLSPKVKKALKFEEITLDMFEDYYDFLDYYQETSALGDPIVNWNLLNKEKEMKIFFFA